MVVETLWPDNAPWWLNLFIWMAYSWQYIMAGFIPAFYIAVVKLFGFPLLQRWQSEVVIMLYPNKAKFRKIDQQWDQYIVDGKGIYWPKNALRPLSSQTINPRFAQQLTNNKNRYEELNSKQNRNKKEEKEMRKLLKQQFVIEKRKLNISPVNTLHLFYHSVNQEIYDLERRETKINEILHGNTKAKMIRVKKHNVWLMQNPKAHFHRHWLVITNPEFTEYQLLPVKERQQFGIGFWHSIGIRFTARPEEEQKQVQEGVNEVSNTNNTQDLILLPPISMSSVVQQIRLGQSYQNFSANKMYSILFERRGPLEKNFWNWITGSLTKEEFMLISVMIGGVASIALLMYFFHGSGASPATGGHPLI